ncbi:ent-kaur-16-ene synthase, chloroplastic-like isoform X2 [Pistacia vera]|uniref:ent-kaur-16-ene synthase, chloroplastic-like isoform X2 n=1 Tax=Pistacia vera TaxID=55513 RepID=UPI00126353C2|nr:ent-kaur-16-ene synthase, chloroplastic-like isoform X2 [Pistacia vera]
MAFHQSPNFTISSSSLSAGAIDPRSKFVTEAKTTSLHLERTKERINKMFDKVDLSVSSYDTAWVAMVPSPDSPQAPCFPQCINWLLDNQLHDGSWGLPQRPSLLVKDALSCTLASVLALKRWGIGEEEMNKGIQFIESNFASINDEKQHTPVGFDIIFPGMIECAKDLNLNLPLRTTDIDSMLHRRQSELRRNLEGRKEYLAYVSEGLWKLQDWEMVMKYQRKNGSLFNSPSATAAALSHIQNAGCLHYLCSVLDKFGDAVPTVCPFDLSARLFMVESLESLGIDRHFENEIRRVLDETYRCWLQEEEEILLDPATCAMAFRLLRVNGYDVSSDPLTKFAEEDQSFNSLGGYSKDTSAVLELYKASQITIDPDEFLLEKQNLWTRRFLEQELSSGSFYSDRHGKQVSKQVEYALKFPYHSQLERLAHRRNIEHYSVDDMRILKTSYRSLTIANEYFQHLAVDDFNICQSIYREELKQLERWVAENRLDRLKFARLTTVYAEFIGAATLLSPELSDARISWAKGIVLTTVIDDFFDVGGSLEELVNLVQLVEKWNVEEGINCCSEEVEIIFSAIHRSICDTGDKAFMSQGRDVTTHVAESWLNLLKSQLKEAEWLRNKSLPTVDEYIENACVTYALGPIVFPTMYLVGPKLPEELVTHPEFHKLYKLASICGRLLNDIQSLKRECKEETLNAVSLQTIHSKGVIAEEEAIENLRSVINSSRRELLRSVLQEKGSIIPRPIKDLFLKTSKSSHLFYMEDDGFTSDSMMNFVNDLIQEQLCVNKL